MRFQNSPLMLFAITFIAAAASSAVGQFLLRDRIGFTEVALVGFIVGLVMVMLYGPARAYRTETEAREMEPEDLPDEESTEDAE